MVPRTLAVFNQLSKALNRAIQSGVAKTVSLLWLRTYAYRSSGLAWPRPAALLEVRPMSSSRGDYSAHGDVSTAAIVRLRLTAEQANQLAPIVKCAATSGQNVLFVALCAPFWNEDGTFWDLQTTLIPARIGHKIIKLVRSQKGGSR